jgi:hypothetical protein
MKPVIEAGTFTVFAGGSSDNVIETKFTVMPR